MGDVFISYARADQPAVERLAAALEARGHALWWDRQLTAGQQFSREIETALDAAGAVLVLWSANSVTSHWVRDEAAVGRDANKLVPVCIDGVSPPLGFRQVHAIKAPKGPDHPEALAAIEAALAPVAGGRAPATVPVSGSTGWQGIAVLPFDDLSPERDQAHLGDGVAEEILNALVKVTPLRVAGRASAFSFAGAGHDLQQIGTALDVAWVLEGSVRKQGERVRIAARLNRVADSATLWSESFDGGLDDIFELQERIARAVVDGLEIALDVDTLRLATSLTGSPAAYDAFLQGRRLVQQQEGDGVLEAAIHHLQEATRLDPDFASAWAWLSNAHFYIVEHTVTDNWAGHLHAGTQAARTALRLAPELSDAHLAMSYVHLLELRLDRQLEARLEAHRLDPASVAATHELSAGWFCIGHAEAAFPLMVEATGNDPFSPAFTSSLGVLHAVRGEYEQGLAAAERTIELGSVLGVFVKALLLNDTAGGTAAADWFMRFTDRHPELLPSDLQPRAARYLYAQAQYRRSGWARRLLAWTLGRMVRDPARAVNLNSKILLGGLNRPKLYFRAIREKPNAYLSGALFLLWLPTEEARQLRTHPDFPQFAEDIGLVRAWQTYGWPAQVQPHPGTDGSGLRFTCS